MVRPWPGSPTSEPATLGTMLSTPELLGNSPGPNPNNLTLSQALAENFMWVLSFTLRDNHGVLLATYVFFLRKSLVSSHTVEPGNGSEFGASSINGDVLLRPESVSPLRSCSQLLRCTFGCVCVEMEIGGFSGTLSGDPDR